MTAEPARPLLRLVDRATGEILEAAPDCPGCAERQHKLDLMLTDLDLLEEACKKLRRENKGLKTRITTLLRDDPEFGVAYELVKWWEKCTGEKAVFDQRCQAGVMKAIKILERHYKTEKDPHALAVRHIAACFRGIARRGFVDPQTRQRHNRIGLVVESGESLMKYLKLDYQYCRETGQAPVELPGGLS